MLGQDITLKNTLIELREVFWEVGRRHPLTEKIALPVPVNLSALGDGCRGCRKLFGRANERPFALHGVAEKCGRVFAMRQGVAPPTGNKIQPELCGVVKNLLLLALG